MKVRFDNLFELKCNKVVVTLLIVCIICVAGFFFTTKYLLDLEARAAAGDLESIYFLGVTLSERGEKAVAYKLFDKAAQQGHVQSQLKMGFILNTDKGSAASVKRAFEWFYKAAEQGSVMGELAVAAAYYHGNGVDVDMAKAISWYDKAATSGSKPAIISLIALYTNGKYKDAMKVQKYKALLKKIVI